MELVLKVIAAIGIAILFAGAMTLFSVIADKFELAVSRFLRNHGS
jgi:hypothetical protein